jgi:hypothetical protein
MIYTVTPAENCFPGVYRHLSECEMFGTKHIYLSQLNEVTENDVVVFGAWDPGSYPMAIRRCHAKKKVVLVTSPLLQMQMNEPELQFLDMILTLRESGVIDYILFADKETYEVFSEVPGVCHLPHPADLKKMEQYKCLDREKCWPLLQNIFCYMPYGNRNKNQITQLAAVKLFQQKNPTAWFFANGMGQWASWADRLQLRYTDQGYLTREDYYRSMCNYRCGLHVTLSESFAYSVLDAFLLEVPVVCSPTIDWAPPNLQVKNPDDPVEISNKLEEVYDGNFVSRGKVARENAVEKIRQNNKKVGEILSMLEK